MEKGENLNRRNLPTLQQLRYLTELEKEDNTRGMIARIAEKMPGQHCTGQPLSEKLLRKRTSYRRLSVYKKRAGMD